jgi:2-succinyl-5-enolpyruvyl-6-hydroxy-3-cyclohexene-1-carboxylate synthase
MLDFRTTNTLWSSVLVETLVRCGLTHAVISPGSRSTPLTLALVQHGAVECVPVLDERSAAFFALGLARRSHRPVVLVCTSGSAGANYFPAVIEAHESQVPLLVLTADRPPELRECASGQTIDQQKYFGDHVVWYHEVALPEPRVELLRYLRQSVRQAWRRALAAGPVHLNLPFRDPLAPESETGAPVTVDGLDETFFAWPEEVAITAAGWQLHQRAFTTRGLIVAGPAQPADPPAYAAHVGSFAAALGWPVLADALSPLRHYASPATVVATYDTVLRNPTLARDLVPRHVICLESWPTSKTLRSWLGRSQAEMLLVSPHPGGRDALHGRTREVTAPVTALTALGSPPADDGYRRAWQQAETAARTGLEAKLGDDALGAFEGKASWLLARHLPAGTTVCVASSMPVRDLEYFWPVNDRRCRVAFSRGANGIDGTLSTALGVAHGGDPAVLLTGDLALLHDTNGFLTASRFRGSLTIVLINNAGGGIFEHLPVARYDPPFEQFFATPQHVDFGRLAAAYGVQHELVPDWERFIAAIVEVPPPGVRMLELRTDRKRDAATRKRLFMDVAAQLGKGSNPNVCG